MIRRKIRKKAPCSGHLDLSVKLRYILPVPGRYAGEGDQAVLNLPGAPGREHRKKLKNSCYFSENRAIMMR